jgi:uncharacterized protein YcaQ
LRAQGLLGGALRSGGTAGFLGRLGAVQLDTISVLARSHELVAYSRLGPTSRAAVEAAYWTEPAVAFEYWSHAACILPLEMWPLFAARRRSWTGARTRSWPPVAEPKARRRVLERLEGGPMTATDFGGARRSTGWFDWAPLKIAAEELVNEGVVVVTRRAGWRRVYDLAERAIPSALREPEPDDDACLRGLVLDAVRRLGIGTAADVAEVHRLRTRDVRLTLEKLELPRVRVDGWADPAWADPTALADGGRGGRHRTTLLSPFDSLLWSRDRVMRLFGFRHKIEAYTPAPARVHGYYAMPVLHRGRLVGRIDPARDGRTLVVRRAFFEPEHADGVAAALREAAEWLGCDGIAVGEATAADMRRELSRQLATLLLLKRDDEAAVA